MLILIAEMDSAGSNYPGAVPWWCLATLRPLFNRPRETRRAFRWWSNTNIRLTRVKAVFSFATNYLWVLESYIGELYFKWSKAATCLDPKDLDCGFDCAILHIQVCNKFQYVVTWPNMSSPSIKERWQRKSVGIDWTSERTSSWRIHFNWEIRSLPSLPLVSIVSFHNWIRRVTI